MGELTKPQLWIKNYWQPKDAGSKVVAFPREVRGNQLRTNPMVSLLWDSVPV